MTVEMSQWALTILNEKYAHEKRNGEKESWTDVARRVSTQVLRSVKAERELINKTRKYITERKFIPGGRYLYASGLTLPQVNNCFMFRAEDSREGWAELMEKCTLSLMTGGGIGVEYSDIREEGAPIRKTRGTSSGPLALMQMINEAGRFIRQGGNRRCLPGGTLVTMADFTKKRISDVAAGDVVLTRFGPRKVLRVFDQGVQKLYKIETTNGSVYSTIRHRWLCSNTSRTKSFYVPVEKLSLSCKLHHHPSPTAGGAYLDTNWAYVLGFYLGDGCAYSSNRTHEVTFQVDSPKHNHDRVNLICKTIEGRFGVTPRVRRGHGEVTEVRCRSKDLVPVFQEYKRPNEPFSIPEEIIHASVEARCAFIAGWFDADGCYSDSWKLCNKWPDVRAQVMSFLRGLGFLSTENGTEVRLCDSQRPAWRRLVSPFSFKRPKGRMYIRASSEVPSRILSISEAGEDRTFDIEVEDVHEFIADDFVSHNSAIWSGLNWSHPDVVKFIRLKDWIPEVRELKEKDFSFPAPMDGTNISVGLDDAFFQAFHDKKDPRHSHAHLVYWETVERMFKTAEPGFSVNLGDSGNENLRNAPVAGGTHVMTGLGYQPVSSLVEKPTTLWTGKRWVTGVTFKKTQTDAPILKVTMTGGREIRCEPSHEFLVRRYAGAGKTRRIEKIDRVPAHKLQVGDVLDVALPTPSIEEFDSEAYTLGWLYGDGSFCKAGGADLTLCTEEKKACSQFLTGYSSNNPQDSRGFHRFYFGVSDRFDGRDHCLFPEEILSRATEDQQASFIAGLWDADGNFDLSQMRVRLSNSNPEFLRNVARTLEQLGILAGVTRNGISTYGKKQEWQLNIMSSYIHRFAALIPTKRVKVQIPDSWKPYRESLIKVLSVDADGTEDVYCCDVGFEEHSFQAEGVVISNCTELVSEDDSDVCNIGSVNLARIESLEEMEDVVEVATAFLLAGTVYSLVPFPKVDSVRTKNRRIGLGILGVHEWLLRRGRKYGPDEELEQYLKIYADNKKHAEKYSKMWKLSVPVKCRAVAPNGTIGIVAETTTGIEPVFCVAYKRRYLDKQSWRYQYVIDPTAKRLIETEVKPEHIEDAYVLAQDVERRVAFQVWVQKFVDHAISSTVNMPAWGSDLNNKNTVKGYGEMLMRYLPELRGITVYPDGARGGQPLVPVQYATAMKHKDQVFEESADVCSITKGGTCGE